ncbi:DUF4136 domain-containing protein [Erythrobacter dokdonensis]|uniref:Lipoprotein n=1 Tax=Erythrobacter dokdonensis DSW-74 TaxID=1300349 RepID=A0A1A7BG36_9SPHN|nr:DUF4136 domain-containing protein [Erythrobacter dokdonensis]MEE4317563.1 DUF4136 domain-containing protein [Erythrobacter sp.]OBV10180.1 Lipoprotein [Erythrobacter dokdonensis DSW-74]
MKPIKLALAAAVLALSLSACSTTGRIVTDFDREQNFAAYQTFAWADESPMAVFGGRIIPPTIEPRVARAIKAALEAKGYRYLDDVAKADFAVSFTIGTRDGTDIVETPDYFWANRTNWRWGLGYYPMLLAPVPMTRTEVREYTEGTLAIDIYDVQRRAPVWHGAATKTLSRAQLRGEPGDVEGAVNTILTGFPPG